jgi:hypothetical protein
MFCAKFSKSSLPGRSSESDTENWSCLRCGHSIGIWFFDVLCGIPVELLALRQLSFFPARSGLAGFLARVEISRLVGIHPSAW